MKTRNTATTLAIIGLALATQAQAQIPSFSVPDHIPFGKIAVIESLSKTQKFEATVYVYVDGERQELNHVTTNISHFSSMEELSDQVQTAVLFDFEVDPRLEIYIEAALQDSGGETMFWTNKTFFLDVERDSTGTPTGYRVPDYAGSLYFWLEKSRINVPNLRRAELVSYDNGVITLDVDEEGFWVPGPASNDNGWHTLRLTFSNGMVVEYDRMGQRVVREDIAMTTNGVSISDVETREVVNRRFEFSDANPDYDWNPVIWLNNTQEGMVTFDIHSNESWWQKPAYVWIITLEDYQAGGEFTVVPYCPQNGMYPENLTIQVPLRANTRYLIINEWRGDVNVGPSVTGTTGTKG